MYFETHTKIREKLDQLENQAELARILGTQRSTINKVFGKGKDVYAKTFFSWLDALGARVVFPDELEALTRSSRVEELLKGKKLEQMSLAELGELFSAIIGLLTDGALRAELGTLQLNPKKEMTIRLDIEPVDTPVNHACEKHCQSSESHENNFEQSEAG